MDKQHLINKIIKWAEIQNFQSVVVNDKEDGLMIYNYQNKKVIVVDLNKMSLRGTKLTEYSSLSGAVKLEKHEINYFKHIGITCEDCQTSYEDEAFLKPSFKIYKGDIITIKRSLEKFGYKKESFVNYLTMSKTEGKYEYKIDYDPVHHTLSKYERKVSYNNWKLIKLTKEEQELLYKKEIKKETLW